MTNMDWTRKNAMRLAILCGLTTVIVIMTVYIEPSSLVIVGVFIVLISTLAGMTASLFLPYIYTLIAGGGVLLFLAMSYLTGFQILNTILLICFIIGLSILVKK